MLGVPVCLELKTRLSVCPFVRRFVISPALKAPSRVPAFVLPIVQALRGRVVPRVRALVILPVQELAAQVFKVFQTYCEGSGLKVKLVSGQKSFAVEQVPLSQELLFSSSLTPEQNELACSSAAIIF